MAKIKTKKALPKKIIDKKAILKKDSERIVPVKPLVSKKQLSGKVVKNTKSGSAGKLLKPALKSALTKNSNNSVAVKIPLKKAPTLKEHLVPVKKMTKSSITKHNPLVKTTPKKEDSKPATRISETPSLPKAKNIKVATPKPVVLPKITTTKSRKYEPEFTRSVLDQTAPENNGPTMRYSDVELNEFRELIQRKLETAKKELGYLQGLITRKDEMGGDETDNRYMTMEDGSLSMEREQLSQMASRQITFIDHLEKAMMRIENKTYGICRITGKLIDKARLRAVPHATLSIEAKMGIAK